MGGTSGVVVGGVDDATEGRRDGGDRIVVGRHHDDRRVTAPAESRRGDETRLREPGARKTFRSPLSSTNVTDAVLTYSRLSTTTGSTPECEGGQDFPLGVR